MREINSNLDKESASQMQFIVVKEAIEALEKAVGEAQSAHTGLERLGDLESRIKVLEESRQRQIALNSTFIQKNTASQETKRVPVVEVKSFWPWKR